jgi:alpha-tubulin suppressor-like RCC1 family protein
LTTDGTLYSFGSNNFGQLGDGTYLDHSTSQFVEVGSGYAAVAAAEDYSFGLKKDNTLWAWGGDWENAQTIPVQIGEGFVKLVARGSSYSSSHLLAEKEDGGLWEWIFYENGGIGVVQPVGIGGGGYKMIAVGDFHSLALLEDGTLLGWGAGGGNDGYLVGSGPSASIIGTGFAAVVAGSGHSLAIKKDGTLWAWGDNYLGQLGDGTTIDRNNPVPVLY